jgi:hypothetical protein
MNRNSMFSSIVTVSIILLAGVATAETSPPYKADVPESITTPVLVQSKYVGDLKFVDGFPTRETVRKTYDFLDTSRAVELFLNAMPTTSM